MLSSPLYKWKNWEVKNFKELSQGHLMTATGDPIIAYPISQTSLSILFIYSLVVPSDLNQDFGLIVLGTADKHVWFSKTLGQME